MRLLIIEHWLSMQLTLTKPFSFGKSLVVYSRIRENKKTNWNTTVICCSFSCYHACSLSIEVFTFFISQYNLAKVGVVYNKVGMFAQK